MKQLIQYALEPLTSISPLDLKELETTPQVRIHVEIAVERYSAWGTIGDVRAVQLPVVSHMSGKRRVRKEP